MELDKSKAWKDQPENFEPDSGSGVFLKLKAGSHQVLFMDEGKIVTNSIPDSTRTWDAVRFNPVYLAFGTDSEIEKEAPKIFDCSAKTLLQEFALLVPKLPNGLLKGQLLSIDVEGEAPKVKYRVTPLYYQLKEGEVSDKPVALDADGKPVVAPVAPPVDKAQTTVHGDDRLPCSRCGELKSPEFMSKHMLKTCSKRPNK